MENLTPITPFLGASLGLVSWWLSKGIRKNIVRKTANDVLNDGTPWEYHTKVVFTTKLLNIVVPAFLGIGTGIGAIIAEINGEHSLALGLTATAIPHLVEIPFNKKIVK